MSKFTNSRKYNFLDKLSSLPSLLESSNDLTKRCKFNLSYFDHSQSAGQNFSDLTHKQLYQLFDKLKDYSKKTLQDWCQQRVGRTGLTVLAIYKGFPAKSSFTHPKHVPHQAKWGRFRIGSKRRLIGFIVPPELHKTLHKKTNEFFDKNTFYIVFLDNNHKFYSTEKK